MTSKNVDFGLLLLRVTFGVLTILHGFYHLKTGLTGVRMMLGAMDLPELLAYGVLVGELLAPMLILLGYYTRLASVIAVINFVMTIVLAHSADIFRLTPYGGWAIELNVLYLVLPLTLIFTGAGKYAINKY